MKKYITMIGLSISFCGGIKISTDIIKTTPTVASLVEIQTPGQFLDVKNEILGFFYNQFQLRRLVEFRVLLDSICKTQPTIHTVRLVEFRVLLDSICKTQPTIHTVNRIRIELAMPEHLETVRLEDKEKFFRQDSEANYISHSVSTQVLQMFEMLYLRFLEERKLGNRFIVFYSFLDVKA